MTRRFLADTHILLWSWHARPELPGRYVDILQSDAIVHVSIATIWEISIKAGLGKLKTIDRVADRISQSGFRLLPIAAEHAEFVRVLPHNHRDPFDRMLIAQAMCENLTLMSVDPTFSAYDVAIA